MRSESKRFEQRRFGGALLPVVLDAHDTPPSCDAMQYSRQCIGNNALSTRNCIIRPIYDGQRTVHCSFAPAVQPHSCKASTHTLFLCFCICCCKRFELYFHSRFSFTVSLVHDIKMKLLFIGLQFEMHKTFRRSKFHCRPPFVGTVL